MVVDFVTVINVTMDILSSTGWQQNSEREIAECHSKRCLHADAIERGRVTTCCGTSKSCDWSKGEMFRRLSPNRPPRVHIQANQVAQETWRHTNRRGQCKGEAQDRFEKGPNGWLAARTIRFLRF
jgi:hypothetical protein